jgi:hypothetical protein
VNATQTTQLFTDLSTEESAVVQGGRCRRRSSYRPTYYSYRSDYPSYNYGYGYGGYGYGGYSSVNQSVNVTVRYDD